MKCISILLIVVAVIVVAWIVVGSALVIVSKYDAAREQREPSL